MIVHPRAGMLVTEKSGAPTREWLRWLVSFIQSVFARPRPTGVKTADYTARIDDLVLLDPSGGPFAVNLPERCEDGAAVHYHNVTGSANNITFEAATGDTVRGAATLVVGMAYSAGTFIYCRDRRDWAPL